MCYFVVCYNFFYEFLLHYLILSRIISWTCHCPAEDKMHGKLVGWHNIRYFGRVYLKTDVYWHKRVYTSFSHATSPSSSLSIRSTLHEWKVLVRYTFVAGEKGTTKVKATIFHRSWRSLINNAWFGLREKGVKKETVIPLSFQPLSPPTVDAFAFPLGAIKPKNKIKRRRVELWIPRSQTQLLTLEQWRYNKENQLTIRGPSAKMSNTM